MGNTLARAVELRRALQAMQAALDEKQLFIREMNHRIKNNLALVGAMLLLQARRLDDSGVRDELGNAVARINNLALVHDRLQLFTSSMTKVDAAAALPGPLRDAAVPVAAGRNASHRGAADPFPATASNP